MGNNKPCDCEEKGETCNCEEECCAQTDEMNTGTDVHPCANEGCLCTGYIDEDF
jgi:hypothetical protein